MRYLWMCLVAGLAACGGGGSASAPLTATEEKPVVSLDEGKYVRFASNIGDQLQQDKEQQEKFESALAALHNSDAFVSIEMTQLGLSAIPQIIDWPRACLVNVLSVEKSSIKSTYHKAKESCDCLTVQPESAVICVGDELISGDNFVFVSGKIDTAVAAIKRFSVDRVCPLLPEDCLGEDAKDWEYAPNLSVGNGAHQYVGETTAKANSHDLDGIDVYEAGKYITREGLEALSLTYKNVQNNYENCELDAQVVVGFDEAGNLIPARRPSVVELEKKEYTDLLKPVPKDDTYTIDYQFVYPTTKNCTLPTSLSDYAILEIVENALSPYADLAEKQEFKPLENGVLTLDYEKKFYEIKEGLCPAIVGTSGIPFIPPDCLGK